MRLYMMCGIPNAGKSTKADKLAAETGATLVRLDDYRKMLHRHSYTEMVNAALSDVKAALERGEDVIYDTANLRRANRAAVMTACEELTPEVVCVYMDTPKDICISRDTFGWSAIGARKLEPPTTDEGFELIVCHDGYEEDTT